jgi:hypothetical protein
MRTRRLAALVVVLCCCLQTNVCRASSDGEPIDLADYTARLRGFYALLDGCERNMSEAACDWRRAAPDVAVRNGGVVRKVELDWLRNALRDAAQAASASSKDLEAKKQSLDAASATLRDARIRLDQELAPQTQMGVRDVAAERAALEKILASGGYAPEVPPTLPQRLWNAFAEWLMRHLTAVAGSQGSQIIVNLLLASLLVIVCGALLWWFARKVQNQRLALSPPNTPLPSAPSFLDWEQWLEQGKGFAREHRWREAIHHVYWAAISLLESRGFWPADRTRTPREYLTLLATRPETVTDLQPLTRSFEHTWYGHEAAGQAEFDRACALLARLER